MLDYAQTYPYQYQLVSNRDQLVYQGDYRFTPHLAALIGFRYEDERGLENVPHLSHMRLLERTNYDYLAAVHGDFKNRFFYTLGGSLEHYSLFGVRPRRAPDFPFMPFARARASSAARASSSTSAMRCANPG